MSVTPVAARLEVLELRIELALILEEREVRGEALLGGLACRLDNLSAARRDIKLADVRDLEAVSARAGGPSPAQEYDARLRATRIDVDHRPAHADRHGRRLDLIRLVRAVSADKPENALHGADCNLARSVVGIEDETVDHHPRVRADDDTGIVGEADLGEALGVGDDGVAHEDVAIGRQHALAARP